MLDDPEAQAMGRESPRTDQSIRRGVLAGVAFLAIVVALGFAMTWGPWARARTRAREVECSGLAPGNRLEFAIGGQPASLSIPADEGVTFGTFRIDVPAAGFDSGLLERDGSLETVWLDDVNGDDREDAVVVVRSGGSGSYVVILVLESTPTGPTLRSLPPLPAAATKGYMGHDAVAVRDGVITRSFPTYNDSTRTRIDQQWDLEDGLRGELPIKRTADANADPSGRTCRLRFGWASFAWR